jgi:2-amino-4-hydroxy-6-hydroxymethyldihydropteridine diphosphokinase
LEHIQWIERSAARERSEHWGPRTLDLDILWISGCLLAEPDLRIPHTGLLERPFALIPLLDVAPDARDPRDDRQLLGLRESLGPSAVRPVERPVWSTLRKRFRALS